MWEGFVNLPWVGIGTAVAAVAALGGFGVALLERRARIKSHYGSFNFRRIGWVDDPGDGKRAETYEFSHQGTAIVTFTGGVYLYGVTAYRSRREADRSGYVGCLWSQ